MRLDLMRDENIELKSIKTTDWLVKGIPKKRLAKEKIQALKREIKYLEAENERLEEDIKAQDSSIKSLTSIVNSNYQNGKADGKAEAYKEVEEKIEKITWYHINKNGELVMGANSETDIPLYKAEDIFNLFKELVGEDNV